jgi:hypothetical protein
MHAIQYGAPYTPARPSQVAWSGQQWHVDVRPDAPSSLDPSSEPLRLEVLRTAKDWMKIAELRKLAAFGVEQDLCLGLAPFEKERDTIGMVTCVSSSTRVMATLRFVQTGRGLTGAERLHQREPFDSEILGQGSWEIGRVIMAPEDRHPETLFQCMRVALLGLLELQDVRRFHATTTLPMARLWRRFGMRTVLTTAGESGTRYALVHGLVEDAAGALGVKLAQ